MRRAEQDTTFTRRKFTITESLDQVLTDLAEENYQGNVSLCLRAAVEDHRNTLEDTGEREQAIRRLRRDLEIIADQQEKTESAIDELVEEFGSFGSGTQERPSTSQTVMSDDMRAVFDLIAETDGGLRIDDLIEQLDMSTPSIHATLCSLVDTALVEHSDKTRFYRAGDPQTR